MEGIFMGRIVGSCSRISEEDGKRCASIYFHDTESNACSKLSHYNKTYSLVLSDDVIKTNDELLKLRDEVKEMKIQIEMLEAANTDRAKNLLAMTKNRDYFEEKADSVEKKYEGLVAEHTKLQAELTEIKTTRTLREAYISGVEKGCESLREERDRWKNRFTSVATDFGKTLAANGVEFTLKEINGDGNWDVVMDIPELNEAKKKITDLEEKLAAAKSNETFWRDRKEEEEDYHHYWLHTYDRVVKQAADKGIHIDIRCTDEACNAGVVVVDNVKAEELEKQVVQMEDANQKLRQRISAADEKIESLENHSYWRNTYYATVTAARNEGVIIVKQGIDMDRNVALVKATNYRGEKLERIGDHLNDAHNKKWSAMTEALKEKGVEVIYMGEEDGKPIIDIKVPEWETDKQWVTKFVQSCADIRAEKFRLERERDELKEQCDILRKDYVVRGQEIGDLNAEIDKLKKELEELKSKIGTCTLAAGADGRIEFIYTYMDGHNEPAHINCLCKNHVTVDAESISHGTIPTCKSCAHYMHNPSRFAHDWCYMPIPKEGGAGYIRKLSKEEAESPACSDYKARKE